MKLSDLTYRASPPAPWSEGDNIPWNDPSFSARMLAEHLSQAHDAASRRSTIIDRHVAWIHDTLLRGRPAAILDLGCGPGLYTSRLARLGHSCTGIDFGPASIEYARNVAVAQGLACQYHLADMRATAFDAGFGLVMCIFGEINVFRRDQAANLLNKAQQALADGGLIVLEVHTFDAIKEIGMRPPTWRTAESGLFGATPYLALEEHFWHAQLSAATNRYYVIDLESGDVARYAQSFQAYTQAQYADLLRASGFGDIAFAPSLSGTAKPDQPDLFVALARKRASDDEAAATEHTDA
jgi:SAM-dependent methyltransferase